MFRALTKTHSDDEVVLIRKFLSLVSIAMFSCLSILACFQAHCSLILNLFSCFCKLYSIS